MDKDLEREVIERLTRIETRLDVFIDTFRQHSEKDGVRLGIVEDQIQAMQVAKDTLEENTLKFQKKVKWTIGILTSLVGLYAAIKGVL